MNSVLVIDDDNSNCRVTEFFLQEEGYRVFTASNGDTGLEVFRQHRPPVVITDVHMPGKNGYDVLNEVLKLEPKTLVIIVTAFSTVQDAVNAMKTGAFDYLTKPFSRDQLCHAIAKAFHLESLRRENLYLKEELSGQDLPTQVIGQSPKMISLLKRVERIAASNASVLIEGESGTGKEVIARVIHKGSQRADKPFIAVNCAAIPKELIESELFGHLKGSFTGAVKDRTGKFALADGGTLFLDEIGELPIDLQPKLLRALQEQEIEPVGGKQEKIDVRIVAATNRNLEDAMGHGTFREDLYYRLAVVPLTLPPLRERIEDIPLLLEHFLKNLHADPKISFSDRVIDRFKDYPWPGNVRELANTIEQMLILKQGNILDIEDLPPRVGRAVERQNNVLNIPEEGYSLEELEKNAVEIALKRCHGNKAKAADFLKIPRHTLAYRIEKYKISTS